MYIRFSIFFPMLAYFSRMYVYSFSNIAFLFVYERHKGQKCFARAGDFLLLKKMDQRICIKFRVKNRIKCSKTLEMLKVGRWVYCKSKKCLYLVQALHRRSRRGDWRARPGREKVIAGDESWVYGYDVEAKAQSSQWKYTESPRPKKARQVQSNVKVLLTVFFDYHGIRSSHHKVVRLIRSITLKLCAFCVKQYERNARNCGKTIHGFCITITHPLTRHCFFVIFWPKTTP